MTIAPGSIELWDACRETATSYFIADAAIHAVGFGRVFTKEQREEQYDNRMDASRRLAEIRKRETLTPNEEALALYQARREAREYHLDEAEEAVVSGSERLRKLHRSAANRVMTLPYDRSER